LTHLEFVATGSHALAEGSGRGREWRGGRRHSPTSTYVP
jgi:hypothetical protein